MHNFSPFIKKLTVLLLMSFTLFSCGGGGGGGGTTPSGTTTPSRYQGTYTGNFNGADSGTWTISVASNNKVTGTAIIMTRQNTTVTLNGTLSTSGNSTLKGTAGFISYTITINTNGMVSGTWVDSQSRTSGTLMGSLVPGSNPAGIFGSVNLNSTDFGIKKFTPNNRTSQTNSILLGANENFSQTLTRDAFNSLINFDMAGKFTDVTLLYSSFNAQNSGYCYKVICNGRITDTACRNIVVNSINKTITFKNAVMSSFINNQICNFAMGTMQVNGTLKW